MTVQSDLVDMAEAALGDAEVRAIVTIMETLEGLDDPETAARVLRAVGARYGVRL